MTSAVDDGSASASSSSADSRLIALVGPFTDLSLRARDHEVQAGVPETHAYVHSTAWPRHSQQARHIARTLICPFSRRRLPQIEQQCQVELTTLPVLAHHQFVVSS